MGGLLHPSPHIMNQQQVCKRATTSKHVTGPKLKSAVLRRKKKEEHHRNGVKVWKAKLLGSTTDNVRASAHVVLWCACSAW